MPGLHYGTLEFVPTIYFVVSKILSKKEQQISKLCTFDNVERLKYDVRINDISLNLIKF